MPQKLKQIVPGFLWNSLKTVATAAGARPPRTMLTARDILMLEKWGSGRRELVEIGVFEGGSALILRKVMDPEGRLTLIDPFVPDSLSGLRGSFAISRLVVHRSRRGRVRFITDFSFNVARRWKEPLDFLFIDGDHSEEACRRDFEDWGRHVTAGGVIVFHDARADRPPEQPWMGAEGSTKVVNDLFRTQRHPSWRIVDEGGSIVVVRRI